MNWRNWDADHNGTLGVCARAYSRGVLLGACIILRDQREVIRSTHACLFVLEHTDEVPRVFRLSTGHGSWFVRPSFLPPPHSSSRRGPHLPPSPSLACSALLSYELRFSLALVSLDHPCYHRHHGRHQHHPVVLDTRNVDTVQNVTISTTHDHHYRHRREYNQYRQFQTRWSSGTGWHRF